MPAMSLAQGSGTVTGRVADQSGKPVPRAVVLLEGTSLSALTDDQGSFRLSPVPAGEQTVVVSFLGFESTRIVVQVEDGKVVRQDIDLQPFGDEVTVRASPILMGQAEALNRQKNLINITNVVAEEQIDSFPDKNVAESIQRIPGIALERDQGEGRYILIRGTEARLNSTTINGERIPSPEAGGRAIALDVIPSDLLQAIEVTKALTPDMDGDAIGGTVNLITKRAPESTRVSVGAGYGQNEIVEDDINKISLLWGDRVGEDNKLGLLFSGSYHDTQRGSHNFEPEYDDGFLGELQLRHYDVERQRAGINTSLDYRASDQSEYFVRYVWNDYEDTEIRRARVDKVEDGEIEREIKDRLQASEITSLAAGGVYQAGTDLIIDYRAVWSRSEEETPNGFDSVFLQEDVIFNPNVSPNSIDPNNIQSNAQNQDFGEFFFDGAEAYSEIAEEEDIIGAIDFTMPFLRDSGQSGLWKYGAKVRFKTKDQNSDVFDVESEDDLALIPFLQGWTPQTSFLDGRYDIGDFQSPTLMRDLEASGMLESEKNLEEDLADFTVDEDTLAGYGMVEIDIGSDSVLLGGLRVEYTENDYLANELVLDEEGDPESLTPVTGSNDYVQLLPMVHWRRRLDENSNLRAAVTRTLARPNFEDLAPFQFIIREDNEIERGNPDLEVTTAWNLDLLYERFLEPVGLFSAGVFYKDLDDNIINFVDDEVRNGDDFEVFQRRNGTGATLLGFEFVFQNQMTSWPAPWDGLGFFVNWTYTDSEQDLQNRSNTPLQGQPEQLGNIALSYEKGGFSGGVAMNYRGEYISEVGDEAAEDLWIDEHTQIDVLFRYQFGPSWSIALEGNNLTDEPFRVYEGTPDRPRQEEYYKSWWTLNVKWDK